jgi:hypothetical protein
LAGAVWFCSSNHRGAVVERMCNRNSGRASAAASIVASAAAAGLSKLCAFATAGTAVAGVFGVFIGLQRWWMGLVEFSWSSGASLVACCVLKGLKDWDPSLTFLSRFVQCKGLQDTRIAETLHAAANAVVASLYADGAQARLVFRRHGGVQDTGSIMFAMCASCNP